MKLFDQVAYLQAELDRVHRLAQTMDAEHRAAIRRELDAIDDANRKQILQAWLGDTK